MGIDFGFMTTPQLHYIVCCINSKGAYGEPTEVGYHSKLASAFLKLYASSGATEPVSLVVRKRHAILVFAFKLISF